MGTREIKRKTGVHLKDLADMVQQIEHLIQIEGTKTKNSKIVLDPKEIEAKIGKTMELLKKELQLPSAPQSDGPKVRIK